MEWFCLFGGVWFGLYCLWLLKQTREAEIEPMDPPQPQKPDPMTCGDNDGHLQDYVAYVKAAAQLYTSTTAPHLKRDFRSSWEMAGALYRVHRRKEFQKKSIQNN